MDESLDGPHQTWVGPQPANTEALPVPPPSHTNYALRPNLASPAEEPVRDTIATFSQTIVESMASRGLRQKNEQLLEKLIVSTIVSIHHPFDLIGARMEVKPHHQI